MFYRTFKKYFSGFLSPAIALLSISSVAEAQTCAGSLGDPVVNVTFGTGTATTALSSAATGASTTYNYVNSACPNDGNYTVTNYTSGCFGNSWFTVADDHTPNDVNGRMAVFNAAYTVGEFYKQTISGLCGNTTYEFAAWVANILRTTACSSSGIDPNLTFRIESLNGTLLGTYSTGNIIESSVINWKQYGFTFTTPASQTQVILKITNNAPGGCGNDIAVDDITFRPCGPTISVSANVPSICAGESVNLSGTVSPGYNKPQFQWQQSSDNAQTWVDIPGATSLNTTISSAPAGTRYRLLAAEQGNITVSYCRIASNPVALAIYAIPKVTLPGSSLDYCVGKSVDLTDFTSAPTATFSWKLDNTDIGLNQSSGTGQVPVFIATNNSNNASITGTFTVTATANGCTSSSQSFKVNICKNPIVNAGLDQTICVGESVKLTATATDGYAPYNYTWDSNLGNGASKTISPTTTTIYTVTVTESKGCIGKDDIKITVNPLPVIGNVTKTDVSIFGQTDGTITVNANGATPLTYSLNGVDYQPSNVFKNLPPGTYSVFVKDANGCQSKKTAVIEEPGELLIDAEVKATSCAGGKDGAVIVKVSGGVTPYKYEWSDGTTGTPELVGRPAGTYSVTVTDAKGASKSVKITIPQPAEIIIIGNVTNVDCHGGSDGKIEIKTESKDPIVKYEWTNEGGKIIATSESISEIPAGNYTLTVTDKNNCVTTAIFKITEPAPITANATPTNTTCFSGKDGKITIAANGGTGAYRYAICSGNNCTNFSNSQVIPTFSTLAVGVYRVQVIDENGCSNISNNISISQAAQLTASANNTSPVCAGETVTLSATNAGTGIRYEWKSPSGGVVSQDVSFAIQNITVAKAGIYTLTVSNESGCQNTTTTNIIVNPLPIVNAGVDQTVCEGTAINLNATASGGTPTYSFGWNNSLGAGAAKTVTPITTTDYIVIVADSKGCKSSDTVRLNINVKPQIFSLSAPIDRTICAGVGGINLTLSGSQTGVLYELIKNNTNIGQGVAGTGNALNMGNQFGGTYQVRATTNTNPTCSLLMDGSVTVNELTPLIADLQYADDTLCVGETMTYTAVPSGGSGTGYTYTWQDGQAGNPRTFTTNSYLLVEVVIKDSRGCMVKRAANLRAVSAIALDVTAAPNPICAGQQVALSATASGATGNLKYEWENGSTNPMRTVTPNTNTTYNIKVTDTKEGCVEQKSVIVVVNPQPQLFNVTGGGAYCAESGGVAINLSGSQMGFNYQLKRDGQNIGVALAGTGAILSFGNQTVTGNYTIEAISSTAPVCAATMSGSAVISIKSKPNISANASPLIVCVGQAVSLNSSPTIVNAVYAWTGPNGFTSSQQNPIIGGAVMANNGTFSVIVTTNEGCKDTASVVLKVNPTPVASITGPVNLCKNNSVTLNGNPNGGTTPFTHTWQIIAGNNLLTLANNNDGTATVNPTGTGTATLSYRVTDTNGCQSPMVNYSIGINAALPSPTISAGAPVGFTSLIGSRYRAFNRPAEKELFLGVPDLGIAPPRRSQADVTWKNTNDVTYEYDPATDQLKAAVINSAGTFNLTYSNVLAQVNTYRPGQNVCAMNVMQISMGSTNEPTGTVAFNNINLNGENLGNISGTGSNNWTIRNFDFGLGFKITGTIILTGTQPTSAEANKVDIFVGNDQTPVVFGCMSANEVCEGQQSTVSFSGLRANTTFNLKYSIGNTSNLASSLTTDNEGNASFQTSALINVQNGAVLSIDSVRRAIANACSLPIKTNNTTILTVNAKPIATISVIENSGITNNDAIICEGESITLTASGGGTYKWNTGANTAAITISPAGNTTYSVTVTSNKRCENTVSQLVTVHPKPKPTATNSGPVCVGEKLIFSAVGRATYEWRNATNNIVSNNSQLTINESQIADNGLYTVKATDTNGCVQKAETEAIVKERPIAKASSNSPRCEGQTLTLSAADAGKGATYSWSGPNGFLRKDEQNPIVLDAQPTNSGKYILTVTKNGCSSTDAIEVFVYANPVAEALSNSPVCENSPLNITTKEIGKGTQYEWYKDGTILLFKTSQFTMPKAQLNDEGEYTLVVTQNSCVSKETILVKIKTLPKVSIKEIMPLCAGETLQFISESSPGATKYEWAGPNGFTSPEESPKIENITTDATGIYEIITTLDDCRDTSRVKVIINATPLALATASPPVCEGKKITLTAADAGTNAKYEWTDPNGNVVSTTIQYQISNAQFSNSGIYKLKVTLGPCSSEDTALVTIHPSPKLNIISVLCDPNLKSYTVQVTSEGGDITASDGKTTKPAPNFFVISDIKTQTDPLIVTVTTDKGCAVSQKVIAPNCTCPKVASPSSDGDKKYCEGQPIPALSVTVGKDETVDWYEKDSDGTPIAEGKASFVPQAAGTYYAQTRNLIHDCVSDNRTAVPLTLVALPSVIIDSTVCSVDLANFVVWLITDKTGIAVTSSEGIAIDFTNGRHEIISASPSGNPTVVITLTNIDGCERKVEIKKPNCLCPDLVAPKNNGDKEVCEKAPNPTLTVIVGTNETADWYDAPSGGNKVATGVTQFTPTQTAVGTHTYYVETRRTDITVRTCVSSFRTAIKLTIKPFPVAFAVSNAPICENEDLQLQTPANADATYSWTGPNGFMATDRSPLQSNATPSMSGKYAVTVTLKGCVSKDTVAVLVKPLPIANTTGVIVCENSTFILKTDSILNAQYEWKNPVAQIVSTNASFIVSHSQLSHSGVYAVKVTLENCSATDTANVMVKPLPLTKALSNSPICSGDTLRLIAADAGTGASYEWKKLGGAVVGTNSSLIIPGSTSNNAGKHILTVIQNGCEKTDTIDVVIKALPVFTIASNSTVCTGDTIKLFTQNPPANATFEWSGANNFLSFQQNPTIANAQINKSGLYQVTVKANGCVKTDTLTFSIKPLPMARILPNAPLCENDTLRLTAENAGTGASYEWKKLDGNIIGTNSSLTILGSSLSNAGKYVLKVTLNGCVNHDTMEVIIKKRPQFTLSSNAPVCEGDTLRLFAKGVPAGATFAWSGPKQFISADSTVICPKATASISGLYQLTTSINGCTFNDSIRVNINPLPTVKAHSNSPVCEGGKLELSTIFVTNTTYLWKTPTGSVISDSSRAIISYLKPNLGGKYTVKVALAGCVNYDTVLVGIKSKPTFKIDSVVCSPSLKTYSIYGKTNGITAAQSGSVIQNDSLFSVSNIDITLKSNLVFTKNGCDSSIVINSPNCQCPGNIPGVEPENQAICDGDDIKILTAKVNTGFTADWYSASTGGSLIVAGTLTFQPSAVGTYYVETRSIVSGCISATRAIATVIANPIPVFLASAIPVSCSGLDLKKDGKLQVGSVQNGLRYDYSNGVTYTGNKTYTTASVLPSNGTLTDTLSNPAKDQPYTIRIFDETNCFADRTVTLSPRICECPRPPFVVPESQAVCSGDTLRTVRGFVDAGITVDWYDEQGNLLKSGSVFFKPTQAGTYYAEARDTTSNCKSSVRAPSFAFINPKPSFELVVTRGTCDGTSIRPDAKITIMDIKHGKRYDFTKAKTYQGSKTYATAMDIPTDGTILKSLTNPSATEFYTVRVFDETGCFADSVVAFEPRICECPRPPFVVPESQAVCSGDTLRTVRGFVDAGITVDWYDEQGNLLKSGSVFFKPTQAGTYYAEARDTTSNCKSSVRAPSFAFINPKPSFELVSEKPSCQQNTAQNDGKISLRNLNYGTKYDFSIGNTYEGNKTFDSAFKIPSDSVLINNITNPIGTQTYTVRVFGEPNCFSDKTITVTRFDCNCTPINVSVLPTSFSICDGETFPEIKGFVGEGTTVDWYDKDGKILKSGAMTFKPTAFGDYFVEGRSLVQSGCVSTTRIKVTGSKIDKPTFTLTSRPATCLGDSAKKDAQIIIENLKEGDKFDYTIGDIYRGSATYQGARPFSQDGLIADNLPNQTQIHTVRVFNKCGSFKDLSIELKKNDCKCSPTHGFSLQVKMKKK